MQTFFLLLLDAKKYEFQFMAHKYGPTQHSTRERGKEGTSNDIAWKKAKELKRIPVENSNPSTVIHRRSIFWFCYVCCVRQVGGEVVFFFFA